MKRIRPFQIVALLGCLVVAGCGGAQVEPAKLAAAKPAAGALNGAKIAAVTEAARKMVEDPAAKVLSLVAVAGKTAGQTDVCGYVTTSKDPSTPLYVELIEKDGNITAERGQVGSNPANLSKVRFMCRNHKDW